MNAEEQYKKMTETPVKKLIIKLAIPTIISMLITSLYNTADTYFVSQLGTSQSGAVGVVFSLMAIIQAVGFTIGMGSGAWISRLLGEKENEKACEVSSTGFYLAIVLGLLITILGNAFISKLMVILGSTETVLPYAIDYGKYILISAPVMASSFVMNNLLRAEGKSKFAMIGLTIGGLINIALDPVFIFTFNFGIKGAAIATGISQLISFSLLLFWFVKGKTVVSLNPKYISKNVITYLTVIKNGLPSLLRQGLASISTVVLNNVACVYGDSALAAMAIVSKIFMMIFAVALGIGQGYMPVVGYNYGAKKFKRVKESFFFTFFVGLSLLTLFGIIIFILSPQIINLFIDNDKKVVEIGSTALRMQCISMPFIPLNVVCNMTFQTIGKSFTATFLSSLRQGVFFIPLILILPSIFGLIGLETSQALSDILTLFLSIPFAVKFIKTINERIA